jgi:signal transduction histidine kinase
MSRWWRWYPSILLGLLVAGCSQPGRIVYRETPIFNSDGRFLSGDLDGDGRSEVWLTVGNRAFVYLAPRRWSGPCEAEISFPGDTIHVASARTLDLTGDGTEELLLPVLRNGWSRIVAIGADLDTFLVVPPMPIYAEHAGVRLSGLSLAGLLDTGRRRLLLVITGGGFLPFPRRLVAWDFERGEEAWAVDFAGQIMDVTWADALEDSPGPEILVGTYANNTGYAVRGQTDAEAMLAMLSARGEILWELSLAGVHGRLIPAFVDLDGDGAQEVVDLLSRGIDRPALNKIELRDPATGRLLQYYPLAGAPQRPLVADLDRDGREEMIVPVESRLAYLNDSIEPEAWWESGCPSVRRVLWLDIVGDPVRELVCEGNSRLTILDARGKILFRSEQRRIMNLLILDSGEPRQTLAVVLPPGSLTRLDLAPPPLDYREILAALGLVYLAIMVGWGILVLVRRRRQTTSEGLWHRLLQEAREFWHGEKAASRRGDLANLLQDAQEDPADPGTQEDLRSAAEAFRRHVCPALEELFRLGHRLRLSPNPRRAVALRETLDEALRSGFPPKVTRRLREMLEEVWEVVRRIRWELLRHYRADLLAELAGCLRSAVSSADTPPEVRLSTTGTPEVLIRPADLRFVLGNLLRNALEAMEGCETRRLTVEVETGPERTWVRISDTGCGMPASQWEKGRLPRQSTKGPGRGEGLRLCQQRLAPYAAYLEVLDSEPGRGTTMQLTLRTVGTRDLPLLSREREGRATCREATR